MGLFPCKARDVIPVLAGEGNRKSLSLQKTLIVERDYIKYINN